jgi:hypothetical protein
MLIQVAPPKRPDPNSPSLVFLQLPDCWQQSHPLASSLQHLETALFLISLKRFPHALVSCVSSIETTIKAGLKISKDETKDEKRDLVELLKLASGRIGPNSTFNNKQLKDMRMARNQITHYGYSPKDDESTAAMLLNTALPFAAQCYTTFFKFSPIPSARLPLDFFPDVMSLLSITLNVWRKRQNSVQSARSSIKYLDYVAHGIRWGTQHSSLSIPQRMILKDATESWEEFDAVGKVKNRLAIELKDPMESFNCPVCGNHDCFTCEFDGGDCFDQGQLFAKSAVCAHCGLSIDETAGDLTDKLISEQVRVRGREICLKYGVKLD